MCEYRLTMHEGDESEVAGGGPAKTGIRFNEEISPSKKDNLLL